MVAETEANASLLGELPRLTVVILSFGRPEILRESLIYWSGLSVKVLVVDGSNVRNATIHDSNKLRYIHAPKSYTDRAAIAAGLVDTEFVVLASDDEIYVPSALERCIRFLSSNPDYVSVCGESVGVVVSSGTVVFSEQYPALRGFSVEDDDGRTRFLRYLESPRVAYYYSVTRSAVWKSAWRAISGVQFPIAGVHELQFEGLMAYLGRVKVLPVLMWVRNLGVPSVRAPDMLEMSGTPFALWWKSRRNFLEKERFVKTVAGYMGNLSALDTNFSQHELEGMVTQGFAAYSRKASTLKRRLATNLRGPVGNFGRRLYRTLRNFGKNDRRMPMASLPEILGPGTEVDWNFFVSYLGPEKVGFVSSAHRAES